MGQINPLTYYDINAALGSKLRVDAVCADAEVGGQKGTALVVEVW